MKQPRAIAALVMSSLMLLAAPAHAADDMTVPDLEVVSRAIGFLDNLPHDGDIAVGIVYPDSAEGRAKAVQTASRLDSVKGPNRTKFNISLISAKNLEQPRGHLDIALLLPNQSSSEIADAVRRNRLISISNDPSCINAKCCVLMVQSGAQVNIVLNTNLAADVGARFSPIFMMMVKRR